MTKHKAYTYEIDEIGIKECGKIKTATKSIEVAQSELKGKKIGDKITSPNAPSNMALYFVGGIVILGLIGVSYYLYKREQDKKVLEDKERELEEKEAALRFKDKKIEELKKIKTPQIAKLKKSNGASNNNFNQKFGL